LHFFAINLGKIVVMRFYLMWKSSCGVLSVVGKGSSVQLHQSYIFSLLRKHCLSIIISKVQARNQLRTPGGAKSFLRGVRTFWTMSNSFKLYPTHFSRGGEKFSRRGFVPPAHPLVTGLV